MTCPSCGTENPTGHKFCGECGTPLAAVCASCGSTNPPGHKFCGECGAPLSSPAARIASSTAREATPPESERRLVSVLFADLVGFTTLSESRDPEEVRELLSRYFDTSRQLIARYGGTVEKFIGDAVMAVWGTPVAREDDAERSVRAALDLVDAVSALGQEVQAPDLRARAGVLTGEAAVTIGAEGQGMVAGDLVNTASRIQAAAPPGAVFVGDVTRRASEAAVAYADAGEHELKGKAEPMHLWHATRVVAGVGGAMRSSGLEAPFVGRDREIRLVKEVFHSSSEKRKAHLVSVIGVAGIGKTRLSIEFEKYTDGLAQDVWWHRGRCLAYGEGVAYWALAEMVRMRAGIAESEDLDSSLRKLRESIASFLVDEEERRWVEPRLAHLLGLEERSVSDQSDLFSAWRLFFERMAEQDPVAMVFEDLQWADSALLDFIEYLLEWSKDLPLFILTLARPELGDRRPTWGASRRNFTSLYMEPLSPDAMDALIRGLVPGLPDELRTRILDRAEGVPLYAVETVRMLLDRGLIEKLGSEYRLTGEVEDLEVPETLHALIAARLDGLTAEERWVLQDAAVMGKTFSKAGLAAVTNASDLDVLLASLVRKEVLQVQADPRSPERGQYGFLQDLVKRVASETLSKKERKARHLAVARYLENDSGYEDEEIVEVVAAHYLQAYEAAPDAEDAAAIKEKAREKLVRAGEHAASLAAHEQAQRYFDEAAELAEDVPRQAELLERAGMAARISGDSDTASARYEKAIELFESVGANHPAARVSARLGEVMWQRGRLGEAVDLMEQSFQVLSGEQPDEDFAFLASDLGRMEFFAGRVDSAMERVEAAIDIAESLWLPEVLSHSLNTLALILYAAKGRRRQGFALLRYALEIALENDQTQAALRAYFNLADLAAQSDRYQLSRDYVNQGLALSRRVGSREREWQFLGQSYSFFLLGDWDTAIDMAHAIPKEKVPEARLAASVFLLFLPEIYLHRGSIEEARNAFAVYPDVDESADTQELSNHAAGRAVLHLAAGEPEQAVEATRESVSYLADVGLGSEPIRQVLLAGIEGAWKLEDRGAVEEFLRIIENTPRGKRPQYLDAHALRFRARIAAADGDDQRADQLYRNAAGLLREIETPFYLAVVLLEYAEELAAHGRIKEAGALLYEARDIFENLRAAPWLERLEKVAAAATLPA
jgi:class 3 adenylate cyclase/tetratricopeptide (TPR) repeat protein